MNISLASLKVLFHIDPAKSIDAQRDEVARLTGQTDISMHIGTDGRGAFIVDLPIYRDGKQLNIHVEAVDNFSHDKLVSIRYGDDTDGGAR